MTEKPVLTVIEGGRAIAANEMHASLSEESEELMLSTPDMAGFALIVWDDEGFMSARVDNSKFNPIPMALLSRLVKEYVDRAIIQ